MFHNTQPSGDYGRCMYPYHNGVGGEKCRAPSIMTNVKPLLPINTTGGHHLQYRSSSQSLQLIGLPRSCDLALAQ